MSELKSRREILRKTAYVVPTVLTLAAKPSFASSGSGRYEHEDEWEKRGKEKDGPGNSQHEREAKKSKKTGKKH
ncbi:MAG TPA: hypothetical protein VFJ27_03175 [Terriglobia bacterium]|jgi:hypothetical protein|nr:hypothetical protein [Terriglobia bacterium]